MERILVESKLGHRIADIKRVVEKAKRAKAEAVSVISSDMRKMINNQEYSDVVFHCRDGNQVHASRLFLVARSVVFHRMLLNGMAESQLSQITLKEISSTALLPVMEFLYTGTLQEHAPKNSKNAYDILGAARFFLLKDLEFFVDYYLLRRVAQAQADIKVATGFLSDTVEYIETLSETVELVAHELVCILDSRSLKLEPLRALTEKAFTYLLEKTKTKNEEPKFLSQFLSQEEFLRFKNIVLWCACKEFAPAEPLTLHTVPPKFQSTLELLERPPVPRELTACEQSGFDMAVGRALASSIKKFLPLVNLRRIHPCVLVHVIEPMEIVPSSVIMDALRFHALRRCDKIWSGMVGWSASFKNHRVYRMNNDGSVIKRTAPGIGFVRHSLAMNREDGDVDYKWEIIVKKVCNRFIEIGLHHDLGSNCIPQDGQSLSGQPGGWALRMDSLGVSVNRKGSHQAHCADRSFVNFGGDYGKLAYGKHYGHENSKIIVILNLFQGKCFFIVDKREPALAWSSFPEGTFFPAVSLGWGSNGAVRIRVLCDKYKDGAEHEDSKDGKDDDDER